MLARILSPLRITSTLPASTTTTYTPRFLLLLPTTSAHHHTRFIHSTQPLRMSSESKIQLKGSCTCKSLQYTLSLNSTEDARTTLCHCRSCRRAFGTNYGLTAKVALDSFSYNDGTETLKKYTQENGVTREFCGECGVFICEYGTEAADKFRYVMWGSLDEPEKIPPKGEFFCKERASWMPEISGVFHKREIKE
ncbi:Mss4-like protein [Cercophora samala]|uniref:Mss4-like protein n=1 Tax=Cercophora samala TaxID=330535 RepID=A0AA39Z9K5_9PEZI|nr:Mss4-like protein [Cercophora samala]